MCTTSQILLHGHGKLLRSAAFAGALIACVSFGLAMASEPPANFSVSPPRILENQAATVTVKGRFAVEAHVALLPGGATRAVAPGAPHRTVFARSGHTIFAGGGFYESGFDVLDASALPTVTMLVKNVGWSVNDLAVQGSRLYVLVGNSTLIAYDISAPARPAELGQVELGGGSMAPALVVKGDRAFAGGRNGTAVIDIRNPTAMHVTTWLTDLSEVASLVLSDSYLFASGAGGLAVYETEGSDALSLVTKLREPARALALVVEGDRLYAAVERPDRSLNARIDILDVADAQHTRLLGSTLLYERNVFGGRDLTGMVVDRARVYACRERGLTVFDAREPGALRLLAHSSDTRLQMGENTRPVLLDDYLIGSSVVDVAVPQEPTRAGQTLVDHGPDALEISEGIVYVAGFGGIATLGLDNPLEPRVLGTFSVPGEMAHGNVVKYGPAVYAPIGSSAKVLDVSDPSIPRLVADLGVDGWPHCVVRDHLYITEPWGQALRVFGVQDPLEPVPVALLPFPKLEPLDIAVLEDGARLAVSGYGGFAIVDISNPARPTLLGGVPLDGYATVVAAHGLLYVGVDGYTHSSRLLVYDVANPRAPRLLEATDVPGDAFLDGSGGRLHLYVQADRQKRLTSDVDVLSLDDPRHPTLTTRLPECSTVRYHQGVSYGAQQSDGVLILREPPPLSAVRRIDAETLELNVPSGMPPGRYHVYVNNGPVDTWEALNAFQVCSARELALRVEPAFGGTPSEVVVPLRWRATLKGSDDLFGSWAERETLLLLPELGPNPVVRFVPDDTFDLDALAIQIKSGGGEVVLRGSREDMARATWAAITGRGGMLLPEIDAYHFGDVDLQTTPGSETRFYYELRDGRVTRAEAFGPQPDHWIEARSVYEAFCDVASRVSFVESRHDRLQELEAFLAAHPEIVVEF